MATHFPRHILQPVHPRIVDRSRKPTGLNGWRLAGFASLAVPIYAAQLPIAVYLPAIYAQNFGLPLATIGAIFLAERLWGALADPLIGSLTATRPNCGRSKQRA